MGTSPLKNKDIMIFLSSRREDEIGKKIYRATSIIRYSVSQLQNGTYSLNLLVRKEGENMFWSYFQKNDILIIVRDYQLYIKNEHIPIRETLIGSAYNEFIMAVHGNQKFYNIYFKLTSDGGYKVRHEYNDNTASKILDTIFSIGMEKRWDSPCLGERNPRK